ncbi:MAG: class I SAM-dependent methyltransferase [Cyclobacteriaceae bacterium]|nr:class I SAM-dependent methyltransferase [Cyclobacteriaceae bacterium]
MFALTLALIVVVGVLLYNYLKYRARIKHTGLLGDWPVKPCSLDEVDPIFHTNEFGPTLDAQVKFVGRGNLVVPGGTSDTEAWILATLAKKSQHIFEFGTCTGKTTYLMAANAPAGAKITTLTLEPSLLPEYKDESSDSKRAVRDALRESVFTTFMYSGTDVENKVTQLFMDSKNFDPTPYKGKMDLIFIDGSHAYSYVLADTEKAFEMVAPGGIILWHDYRGPFDTRDVYKALNKVASGKTLRNIKETSLVVYKQPA